MKFTKCFILCFFILLSAYCLAKSQTTAVVYDTIQKYSVHEDAILQNIRKQQKNDSMKRVALEKKLTAMESNSKKDRQRLLKEITLLKNRDSLMLAQKKEKVDSLRTLNKGVPVIPFRDTLFTIYNQVGNYTVNDRALAVEKKIRLLTSNSKFSPDSLQLTQNENGWIISFDKDIVVSINEQDALWANMTAKQLAKSYRQIIKNAIEQRRNETSLERVLTEVILSLAIICAVLLMIFGINKLINWAKLKISTLKGIYFKGIKVRGYELISPDKELRLAWSILTIVKWLLIILFIYIALPLILNLFPSTEGYAPMLINYLVSPVRKLMISVVDYLPNLITIVIISIVFRLILRALKFFAKELNNGHLAISGFYQDWAMPTYQILRVLLFAFYLVVIFPYFPGSDTPVFRGVSVFIGVLFTFSSTGPVGNIISGLMLTYMRSFSIGDRIKIGEIAGDIIEKNLLVTRIRTIKNEVISIPNTQILNSHTINYSMESDTHPLIIYTQISIGYDVPWQTIHELSLKACNKINLLEKNPSPFVMQISLDDFYVTYQINAYTKHSHHQAEIYSELHKQVLDAFHEAGVEIMSPHYTAVRDGSQKGIPTEVVDENSFINRFRVEITNKKEAKESKEKKGKGKENRN